MGFLDRTVKRTTPNEKSGESGDWDTPEKSGKGESELVRFTPSRWRLRRERHISPAPLPGVVSGLETRNQELSDERRSQKPPASRVRHNGSFERCVDTVTQRVPAATVSQPANQYWADRKVRQKAQPARGERENKTEAQEIGRVWQTPEDLYNGAERKTASPHCKVE